MSFRFSPLRRVALLTLAAGLPLAAAHAQQRPAAPTPWADDAAARFAATSGQYASWLHHYRAVSLDVAALQPVLAAAPLEGSTAAARGLATVLTVPLPDGTSGRFRVVEAPVMDPALAAQFPQIKTYAGVGLDDATASIRCDLTPLGFHAQILSRAMGTIYIDPVSLTDQTHYLSFYRRDMNRAARGGQTGCGYVPTTANDPAQRAQNPVAAAGSPAARNVQVAAGSTLRSYRLAQACTNQYRAARGGTTASALASMTTSVNRVTGVYEKELAVRLVMVPNTNLLIATSNSTYSNNSPGAMLTQNQDRCDQIIGSANYDIGHVFATSFGGVAFRGSVCNNNDKAGGVTGLPDPTGDAFDIDFVAHEMGHQFGGNHTFNGTSGNCTSGTRNPTTSWEPGSGSTIMGYAGICDGSGGSTSQDLQLHSDAYFHSGSFEEIQAEIASTSCFTTLPTGNTPPTVTVPVSGKTIPKGTAFRLTATGADADGDALTYNWEDMDRGGSTGKAPSTATNQVANQPDPLFRSFDATTSPTRYFPQLTKIISGAAPVKGEAYPQVTRALKFRCTVRDEHPSAALGFVVGGVNVSSTITVNVVSTAGPFVVLTPNGPGGTQWYQGAPATVTWDVANTTAAPVSCANVDLILSRDGGLTYTDTLAANVPNSGTATFTVPPTVPVTTTARVMVHARNNFFFDISNANFSIQPALSPDYTLSVGPGTRAVCPGATATYTVDIASLAGFTAPVSLTVAGAPAGVTTSFASTTVTPGAAGTTLNVTASASVAAGTYPLTVTATAGTNVKTANVTLTVNPQIAAAAAPTGPADAATNQALAPTFTWTAAPGATSYTLELSANPGFTGTLVRSVPNLTGTTYTLTGAPLALNTTYYWRVRSTNTCGEGPLSTVSSFTTSVLAPDYTFDVTPATRTLCANAVASFAVNVGSVSGFTTAVNLTITGVPANVTSLFSATTMTPGGTAGALVLTAAATAASGTHTLIVRAAAGTNVKTDTITLTVVGSVRAAVSLTAPANAAVAQPLAPTFTWAAVANAATYTFELATTSTFTSPLLDSVPNLTARTYTYTGAALNPNTNYYWRVRGENSCGIGPVSGTRMFRTLVLGVSADALAGQLTVAPNPSAGEFSLVLTDAPAGATRLTVVDAVGRTVHAATLAGGGSALTHTLDLRRQAEGVYTLRLTLPDGRTAVRRLVKL